LLCYSVTSACATSSRVKSRSTYRSPSMKTLRLGQWCRGNMALVYIRQAPEVKGLWSCQRTFQVRHELNSRGRTSGFLHDPNLSILTKAFLGPAWLRGTVYRLADRFPARDCNFRLNAPALAPRLIVSRGELCHGIPRRVETVQNYLPSFGHPPPLPACAGDETLVAGVTKGKLNGGVMIGGLIGVLKLLTFFVSVT